MTILYRPVLIESAEQAEALPEGIVLIRDDHYAFQKDKGRFVSADPHDLPVAHAWEVVGWAALVPIEAEEETGKTWPGDKPYYTHMRIGSSSVRYVIRDEDDGPLLADVTDEVDAWEATRRARTRYVTPWEEA